MFKKNKEKLSRKERKQIEKELKLNEESPKEEVKYRYVDEEVNYKVESKAERNPMLGFKFWFFTLGAAILLTLGVWILVDKSLGTKLSIGVTGASIFLLGILRFIPLFKGVKNKKTKLSIFGEIAIEIIVGIFLFIVAFLMQKNGESSLSNFVSKYYKYFLGSVLYLKAVFYFINTSLLHEDTYKMEFWTHIIIITLACIVFALNFDASSIGLLVAILCLLSALAIGAASGGSYYKYHKNKPKDTTKKQDKKHKKDKENVILPQIDNDSDSAIVQ